jgi:hypothetical protein
MQLVNSNVFFKRQHKTLSLGHLEFAYAFDGQLRHDRPPNAFEVALCQVVGESAIDGVRLRQRQGRAPPNSSSAYTVPEVISSVFLQSPSHASFQIL